ncbi:MAG: phosphoribosyltransferase [Methanosarcinaceae archaeon]|nr:phosphoribosyltransferase [Methanosarcinaceae archaeon]
MIIRNKTINSNHLSAKKRSLEEELDSLTIDNEEIIRYKQVLLLDDITTRDISFKAARQKLTDAGATLVAAIALGQTQF